MHTDLKTGPLTACRQNLLKDDPFTVPQDQLGAGGPADPNDPNNLEGEKPAQPRQDHYDDDQMETDPGWWLRALIVARRWGATRRTRGTGGWLCGRCPRHQER